VLGNSVTVYSSHENVCSSALKDSEIQGHIDVTQSSVINSPSPCEAPPPRLSRVREINEKQGLSEESVSIIMRSWRKSTHKQYGVYLEKWFKFIEGKVDRNNKVSFNLVIEFLTWLYNPGLGYSALNTAKSALASFECLDDNSSLSD
jgi:hypothetical protein